MVVVDKPAGWTSHDVVAKMRGIAGTRRIGHLGTLDPLATGVLPLMIGKATRLAQFFGRNDKVYEATIRFGKSTNTYDAEGAATSPEVTVSLEAQEVEAALASFRGRFLQTPPPVSAKKVGGVPAYKLARRNVEVALAPVEVEIYSLDLLRCGASEIDVRARCSAGTYMRSLAHDLGIDLGTGGYLKALRRTASGPFTLDGAYTLEALGQLAAAGRIAEALLSAAQLLPEMPCEPVDSITAGQIRQGRDFRVSPFRPGGVGGRYVKAISTEGELIAIGEAKLPHLYHPILVL